MNNGNEEYMKVWKDGKGNILEKSRMLFDIFKQTCDQYIFAFDPKNKKYMISPNLMADFALPRLSFDGLKQQWKKLIHPEDLDAYCQQQQRFLTGQVEESIGEYRVKNCRGEYVWLGIHAKSVLSEGGEILFYAGVLSDLGQRRDADALTGLLNKYRFEQAVKICLAEYRETGNSGALMILGLDNFKIINETYNRFYGDTVLQEVSQRIEAVLPPELRLYKLDGDEFGIVIKNATTEYIEQLFQDVQRCTALPQEINQKMYFCTVSAGTVFYPQGGKDYLVLHKHAEAALDMAKKQGKNKNCIFSRENYNRWVRSIAMRDDLKKSVEQNCEGFTLFFQPQVEASSRMLCGAEALLRWQNSKGKMVAPMEFIRQLEETKLIIPVGKWVFESAVKVCKKWQEILPDFHMSVNVSYEQLKDATFKEFVPACLSEHGLSPQSVTLELTESCIVADWGYVNKTFDFFRDRGVRIAMDDFGTGYSSLSYLKNLSTDVVKIDREFVRKILFSDFDRMLVRYTVELCHSVGMKACIEGVETKEEYRLLTEECGADLIQGYLFGRPECEADFLRKFILNKENLQVEV